MVENTQESGLIHSAYQPDSAAAPLRWANLKEALGVDPHQSRPLIREILAFHEAWARILFHECHDGGPSPARAAVRMIHERPDLEESAFVPVAFWLAGEGDVDDRYSTHREQLAALEAGFREQFRSLLDPTQREAFDAFADQPLWYLDVGYWPHFQRLGELYWSESCLQNDAPEGIAQTMLGPGATAIPKAALVQGRFCPRPFDYAQVDPDGNVFGCCPSMLFKSFGNLRTQGFMEAWNSDIAVAVRQSILDGSYRYCSERACPDIQGGRLSRNEDVTDPEHRAFIEQQTSYLPRGPRQINMAYDQTCNLKCPSCRSDMIIAQGEVAERLREIHQVVLGEHLGDAQRLIITGSGDPFASRFYLDFLQHFDPATAPGLRIQLSTNGLLLNERMWNSICHEIIDEIDLSVDAATPETYKKNRGGNFEKLCKNLAFIGRLRRSGAVRRFQLLFVVQENNYAEMPAFVRLGLRVHADRIVFKQLQNWGSWSIEGYHQRAIQEAAHPEHRAFREVLSRPELHHPRADLFDLQHLRPPAVAAPTQSGPMDASPAPWKHHLLQALLRAKPDGRLPVLELLAPYDTIAIDALLIELDCRAWHLDGDLLAPEDTDALLEMRSEWAAQHGDASAAIYPCPEDDPIRKLLLDAQRAIAPEGPLKKNSFATFRRTLQLDEIQSVYLFHHLRLMRESMANLVCLPDHASGEAPIRALIGNGEPGNVKAFLKRLAETTPLGSEHSYLEAQWRVEKSVAQAMEQVLNPEQRTIFQGYTRKLAAIELGIDPLAEKLRALR